MDPVVPIRKRLMLAFLVHTPAALLMLAGYVVSKKKQIPLWMLTRDPADISQVSPFVGAISNIGILLWCAAATICFFTFLISMKQMCNPLQKFFLLASAILTTILMIDDFFLVHEWIFPVYFNLDQKYVLFFYLAITCIYFLIFKNVIIESDFFFIMLSIIFFSLSLIIDIIVDNYSEFSQIIVDYHLFEDGFKLFGITSWLTYFTLYSLKSVTKKPSEERLL